ncbi:MAG: ribonuclease Z [Lachnospiraceae bacterium]|nr:ribonuclease Z [Lachnospiraceae bacterium]
MLDVCLLGTGGMMPLPSRWLTSLMTRCNGKNLLIDCGEGTQVTIRQKGWSVHDIEVICFTHYHGDHISGLPGLLLSMGNSDRTKPVTLIGPKGLERVVNALRVIAPELPFEIKYIELTESNTHISIEGYEIDAFKVNHNVVCYGYTISILRGGRFYVEKAMENNVPKQYWSKLQKGENVIDEDGRVFTPDMVIGQARKGIKVTYCTDTRPTKSIVDNAKESDLLICEGMYGEDDMVEKAKINKHMTFEEAATIAKEAKVNQLWLTHYSPSLIRPEDYVEKARKIFTNTIAAKDRRTITLEFDKSE